MMAMIAGMILFGGNCMAADNAKEWKFRSSDVTVIQIETDAGDIRVTAADGPEIKAGLAGGDLPGKCEITARVSGGKLLLAAHAPKTWFLSGSGCKAGFAVTAPADKRLIIKTGAGAVEAGKFEAGADISSGAGGVKLAGLSGPVAINSGAGAITGELYSEDFKSSSGAGPVDLAWLRSPERGSALISTGAGAVRLAFPKESKISIRHSSGVGNLKSELASDPSARFALSVKTGVGSTEIRGLASTRK